MCGVSFRIPTNIKNIPNNIDKLFKTIPDDAAILNLSNISFDQTIRFSLKAVMKAVFLKLQTKQIIKIKKIDVFFIRFLFARDSCLIFYMFFFLFKNKPKN